MTARDRDMSGVSLTAHYTATAWQRLGVPEAGRFATWQGRALHALARPLERAAVALGIGDLQSLLLAPRRALIDAALDRSGCARFVEIAAGLSPLGVARSRDPLVSYVEVDLPAMSALKEGLVGGAKGPGLRFVAGDALDPETWARAAAALDGEGSVAVLAEGLSQYLPRPALERLLALSHDFLVREGDGVLVVDTTPLAALRRFGLLARIFQRAVAVVARWPVPLPIRDREDGVALLRAAGFDRVVAHTAPGSRDAVLVFEAWAGPRARPGRRHDPTIA